MKYQRKTVLWGLLILTALLLGANHALAQSRPEHLWQKAVEKHRIKGVGREDLRRAPKKLPVSDVQVEIPEIDPDNSTGAKKFNVPQPPLPQPLSDFEKQEEYGTVSGALTLEEVDYKIYVMEKGSSTKHIPTALVYVAEWLGGDKLPGKLSGLITYTPQKDSEGNDLFYEGMTDNENVLKTKFPKGSDLLIGARADHVDLYSVHTIKLKDKDIKQDGYATIKLKRMWDDYRLLAMKVYSAEYPAGGCAPTEEGGQITLVRKSQPDLGGEIWIGVSRMCFDGKQQFVFCNPSDKNPSKIDPGKQVFGTYSTHTTTPTRAPMKLYKLNTSMNPVLSYKEEPPSPGDEMYMITILSDMPVFIYTPEKALDFYKLGTFDSGPSEKYSHLGKMNEPCKFSDGTESLRSKILIDSNDNLPRHFSIVAFPDISIDEVKKNVGAFNINNMIGCEFKSHLSEYADY